MVKHIVFWNLKKEMTGEERDNAAQHIKKGLESLAGVVPGLLDAQVGVNFNPDGWDLCLCSTLESREALEGYQVHPEHVKMKGYVHASICERAVVDYEF